MRLSEWEIEEAIRQYVNCADAEVRLVGKVDDWIEAEVTLPEVGSFTTEQVRSVLKELTCDGHYIDDLIRKMTPTR